MSTPWGGRAGGRRRPRAPQVQLLHRHLRSARHAALPALLLPQVLPPLDEPGQAAVPYVPRGLHEIRDPEPAHQHHAGSHDPPRAAGPSPFQTSRAITHAATAAAPLVACSAALASCWPWHTPPVRCLSPLRVTPRPLHSAMALRLVRSVHSTSMCVSGRARAALMAEGVTALPRSRHRSAMRPLARRSPTPRGRMRRT